MATNGNRINFQVGFNVDKSSLNQVSQAFQKIQNIKPVNFSGTQKELNEIKAEALQVENALNKAFNPKLNSINLSSFKKQLGGLSLDKIYTDFSKLGATGQAAFNSMSTSILTTNLNLKQTSSFIQNIGTTMMNTLKWSMASKLIQGFASSVSQAFTYVKSLDSSLNDIRIVTKDSADEMANFAVQANRAASELGRSTLDYTKAALTFYQQGLDEQAVQARTQAVLKAQNITGAGSEMADYLTAVWNGYKVANQEAELYVDKLAAVADSSASNMSQIAIAMSKVSSAANVLGVDVDSLAAQIATITATTRQAPQSVGNALKTVYARINDISTGADDAQVSLGNYSKAMLKVGVSVLDSNGKLRNTGDVIDEIGEKWGNLSREQQIFLARTMAGQRQYNKLITLFDNWGKYTDLVTVSMQSQGATTEKNAIYMDSLAAHMEKLGTAQQRVKSSMIDSDSYKNLIDVGTVGLQFIANFIEAIGGGGNALLMLGSIATQVFSGIIAKQINNVVTNMRNAKQNVQIVNNAVAEINRQAQVGNGSLTASRELSSIKDIYGSITNQQREYLNNLLIIQTKEENQVNILKEQKDQAEQLRLKMAQAMNVDATGKDDWKELAIKIDEVKTRIASMGAAYKAVSNNAEALRNKSNFDIIRQQIIRVNKQLGGSNEQLNKVAEIFQTKLKNVGNLNVWDRAKVQAFVDDLKKSVQEVQTELNTINPDNIDNINNSLKQSEIAAKNAEQATKRFKEALRSQANIQGIVKGVAGLGQMASGIRSLINLYDVWNNKNLSVGEKILQTFTSLSMGIGMLTSGFSNLAKGGKSVVSILTTYGQKVVAAKAAEAAATNASTAAIIKETAAETSQTLASELATKANVKQAAAESGVSVEAFAAALAQTSKTVTDQTQAIAATKAAFANEMLAAALHKVWTAMVPFLIGGAIAAGIIAIGVALANMPSELEKAKEQANRLNQVAKDNYANLSAISSAVRTISSDFKQLSDAENTLNNLSTGTQEWAEQLGVVNQQVTDLIQKYPQLKQFLQIDANGQLGFRQGAMQAVQSGLKQQQGAAAASYVSAERSANEANNQVLIAQLVEDLNKKGLHIDTKDAASLIESASVKGIENLVKAADFDFDKDGKLTQSERELMDSINDIKAPIQEVISAIEANNLKTDNLIATMIKTSTDFSQFKGFNNIANQAGQEAFKNAFANRVSNLGQSDLNRKYFDTRITNMQTGDTEYNLNMDRVVQAYEKQLTDALGTAVDIIEGQDGKFTYQFAGKTVELTKQGIISGLAYFENKDDLAKQIAETIQKLLPLGEDALIFANGTENIDYTQLSSNQIVKLLKNKDAIAQALGLDDSSAIEAALNQAHNKIATSIENFAETLSPTVQKAFNALDKKDMTEAVQKQIGTAMQKAFAKGIDPNQLAGFYSKITNFDALDTLNLDFNTATIDDLRNALREAGLTTNYTNEQLQAYIDAQKQVQEVTLETLQNNYKTIHDITDKLKDGGSISAQDAAKLEAAGLDLENFFIPMLDGTFKLKTSAEEFYNYANNQSLEGFYNHVDELQKNIQVVKSSLESGTDLTTSAAKWSENGNDLSADQEKLNAQLQILQILKIQDAQYREILQKQKNGKQLHQEDYEYIANLIAAQGDLNQKVEGWEKDLNTINQGLDEAGKLVRNLDPDVNEDQWKNLSKYLKKYGKDIKGVSKDIDGNKKSSEALAEELLRYQSALEKVSKKYEDWQDALGEDASISQHTQATAELQDAYSDLLGLPFDGLSDNFTGNLDNLELFKQALQGDEAAYNQLAEAARQDIIANAKMSDEAFQIQFNHLWNQIEQFNGTSLSDLQVGASLNDEDFLNGLTELVNAAGMTAEQATNYLASMGIDAEVVEQSTPTTEKKQTGGFTGEWVAKPTFETVLGADNIPHTYPVSRSYWKVTPQKETVETTSENKAVALKVTSAHKSSGGGFKHKNTTHPGSKSGGGGGGGGGGSAPKQQHVKPHESKPLYDLPDKGKGGSNQKSKDQIEDIYDPYEQITKQYERQKEIIDDIADQENKLSGKDRLKNLQQQNKTLQKQNEIIQQRLEKSKDTEDKGTTANLRDQLEKTFDKKIGFDKDGQVKSVVESTNWAAQQYNTVVKQVEDEIENRKAQANKEAEDAEKAYEDWRQEWNQKSAQDQEKANEEIKKQYDGLYDTVQAYQKAILDDAREAAKEAAEEDIKEFQQKKQDAKDLYDERVKLIEEYQQRLKEDKEFYKQYIENLEKQIENTIAEVQLKVQLKIDIGDFKRQWLDFRDKFISPIGDKDYAKKAKSAYNRFNSYTDSGELQKAFEAAQNTRSNINTLKRGRGRLIRNNGTATEADFKALEEAGISKEEWDNTKTWKDRKKLIDGIIGQQTEALKGYITTIQDQLIEMQQQADQIRETLLSAYDELADNQATIINQYHRVNDVIEHGAKLSQMVFGEKAYAQAEKFQKDQIKNDKRELNKLKQYKEYWENIYKTTDDQELKQKALENMNDYTDQLRSKVEQIIEEATQLLQTRINQAIDNALNQLSGPLGYEGMQNEWQHAKDYDNSFLDVAESKMGIEQIQRLYDGVAKSLKAGSKQAKKFNEFQNKILKQLREKKVLTQYDLDRAKAQLDIEKAKYALQQAREKKVELRLRRDSQGNYTYQYVADEQALEDKTAQLQQKIKNLYQLDKDAYISAVDDIQKRGEEYARTMAQLQQEYAQAQKAGDTERMARLKQMMDMETTQYQKYMEAAGENLQYVSNVYLPESYGAAMGKTFATAEEAIQDMKNNVAIFKTSAGEYVKAITGNGGIVPTFDALMKQINDDINKYNTTVSYALNAQGITEAADGAYKLAEGIDAMAKSERDMLGEYNKVLKETQKQIDAVDELLQKAQAAIKEIKDTGVIIKELLAGYNLVQQQNDFDNSDSGKIKSEKYTKENLNQMKTQIGTMIDEFINLLNPDAVSASTGGYTGQWGSYGKLAYLHEKELVLNAADTENILAAVAAVRDMTSHMSLSDSLNSLSNSSSSLLSSLFNKHQQLDQNVHIEATFPNVRDHLEIEQAFDNLINIASMYASKRE